MRIKSCIDWLTAAEQTAFKDMTKKEAQAYLKGYEAAVMDYERAHRTASQNMEGRLALLEEAVDQSTKRKNGR